MRLDSILIFPGDAETALVTTAGRQPIPIRRALDFDRFAEDLRRATSAAVEVSDDLLLPPVAEGVFFVCRPDVIDRSLAIETERPRLLAAHTVVADEIRTYALRRAEETALAAVIEGGQYRAWLAGRDRGASAAFYGLKTVGQNLGASWRRNPLAEGPNYALLEDAQARGLPSFLADYLEAYARLL